jgi:hypothetical protein
MPNYQNGKIYMLTTQKNCKIYIGSTTQTLNKRFSKHQSKYRKWSDGSDKEYITSYEILEYDDCKIELIEECPCNDKTEIYKREAHHMMLNKDFIVNKHITGRTRKDFREDNKERLKEENKEWRDNNPEYIKEYNKTYYDENKETIIEQHKEYVKVNSESIKAKQKEYHTKNIEHCRIRDRAYYQDNKEVILLKQKETYLCVACNKEITKRYRPKHEKTATHIKKTYSI